MKIVAAITDEKVIQRILEHLGQWPQSEPIPTDSRAPPPTDLVPLPSQDSAEDYSQVPPWWDADDAYSQLPPEDAA